MRLVRFIFIVLLLAPTAMADLGDGGTTSPFALGSGSRELALGGSNMAVADASTAPYWNPARLATVEHISFAGFYSQLFDKDVQYQYFGVAFPTLDFGTFGLGVFRLGVNGIDLRDASNFSLGETDESRLAVYLAYGRMIGQFNAGVSISIEHQSLAEYSVTSSPGVNLALSRRFTPDLSWVDHVTLAANGSNLLQQGSTLSDDQVDYPYSVSGGIAVGVLPEPNGVHRGTLSAAIFKTDYARTRLSVGLEYSYKGLASLRAGVRDSKLSLGGGIAYGPLSFDYAWVDRDLDAIHTFTLTTALGASMTEKRTQRAQQREADFERLMGDRMAQSNLSMINQMVSRGEEALESGNLPEAERQFDRALFIARSNGQDTLRISNLLTDTRAQLNELNSEIRFAELLDSAVSKLDQFDYLATRYFAALALAEKPASAQAMQIKRDAEEALAQVARREELVRVQVFTVDSLLSHGLIDEAAIAVQTIIAYRDQYPNIQLALRRVHTEQWQQRATQLYADGEYVLALAVVDSILSVVPGHQWSQEMRSRLRGRIQRQQVAVAPAQVTAGPLRPELAREVDQAYQSGQAYFQDGRLKEAIAEWESVYKLAPGHKSVAEYLVSAYKYLGIELYSENKLDEAVEMWRKASRLQPENAEIASYIRRTENEIRKLQELTYDE